MSARTEKVLSHNYASILKSLIDKQLIPPDIARYDDHFLRTTIQKRFEATHCRQAGDYPDLLLNNAGEAGLLSVSLQISYSEFFRNSLTYSVLERIILPELVHKMKNNKRKEIRIWSSACAGGQEAYSLAMLLEELKNEGGSHFDYRIFATDQNEQLLNEARKGYFSESLLNNVNVRRTKQWFTKKGDTYSVKQELKNNINFSVFDLFNNQYSCPPASIFGDFDLVVCANLLFYYKTDYRRAIIGKAGNCLSKGGFLVTGETERQILTDYGYNEVYPQSAIFKSR